MTFLLNETHEMIKKTCRQFAQQRLMPNAHLFDQEHRFPKEEIQALGQLGMMGVYVPEEFGGSGLDALSYVVAMEEISAGCASSGAKASEKSLFAAGSEAISRGPREVDS